MSDIWREDPNSDSDNYVAQSNIGGWSRISSHPVVPVEPVGIVVVYEDEERLNQWRPLRPSNIPEGRYALVRVEADDE